MLRKIRTCLGLVMLVGITLLFLDVTGALHTWLGWMAHIQFLPAVLSLNLLIVAALVVLTLLLGRIYCSVICPLGLYQDAVAWISRRVNKRKHYSYSPGLTWLRIAMLVIFIAALVAGIGTVVALLAPYSSFGRMVVNLLAPFYRWGNNLLAAAAEHVDSYTFYSVDVWMRSLPAFLVALATAVIIGILAWRNGRTYCNTICPVGTVLGFLSRFSIVRVRMDADKCRNCGKCARSCKASCIDVKNHRVDYSRCVACGDCLDQCNFDALHYCVKLPQPTTPSASDNATAKKETATTEKATAATEKATAATEKATAATDEGRRAFITIAAAAAGGAALAQTSSKFDGGLAPIIDKVRPERLTPLAPPGAISLANLQSHCTACQLCVAQCPNNVLVPSTDALHLMIPTMTYERGYCRPECNRCSQVCPTGAIRPIDKALKSSTQIGHAVWVKKNCVVLTDGVSCGNCATHCPSGAITMIPYTHEGNEVMIPAVNVERCIGCGACEHLCPARPFSAIYVEGHDKHRTV